MSEPTIDHEQGNELLAPEIDIPEAQATTLDPEAEPEITPEPEPTPEPKDGVEAAAAQAAENAAALEETPAWEPDYKYKVRDTEHEIEDWARPFIKDEATQKKFTDLYTRGHGLEIAKTEREEVQTKYDNLEQSLGILNGYVKQYYENPQQGAQAASQFIDALGLPKQMFLQYALSELKYNELSPEQKVEVDAQRQQHSQVQQLQMQNQQLTEQYTQTAVNHRAMELNSALADVNVQTVSRNYDTQLGREGAFFDLVVERGIYHDKVNGQDIPVEQAIREAAQMIGASIQAGTPPVPQPQTGQQVGTPPVQQHAQKKPVLPNISGQGSASPVKRVVNSIDDIRKRHAELTAQG